MDQRCAVFVPSVTLGDVHTKTIRSLAPLRVAVALSADTPKRERPLPAPKRTAGKRHFCLVIARRSCLTVRNKLGDDAQDAVVHIAVERWIHRIQRTFERLNAFVGIAYDVGHEAQRDRLVVFLVVLWSLTEVAVDLDSF